MIVEELSREECLQVLAESRLKRLACAADNQPYVVPVYLAYHQTPDGDDCLYGFTTFGQKVEWMRANPQVCVEVDDVSFRSEWVSVVAFGRYEELPNVHEQPARRVPARSSPNNSHGQRAAASVYANEQLLAHKLLEARAMWWEPAATVRTGVQHAEPANRFSPVFYKIHLTKVTGYRAQSERPTPPTPIREDSVPCPQSTIGGWLQRTFQRLRGGLRGAGTANYYTDKQRITR